MRLRVLAVLGLIALAAYRYCGGSDAAKPAAHATPIATAKPSAMHGDPNRVDLVMLRAAMARIRKVDITAGDLRLEGQAVDDKQQPIGGATITLAGVRTTMTEQDGTFAFDNLAKGDYELAGARDRMYGEDSVSLDDNSEPLILTLRYGPTLTVRVVDHAGPQVGAKIEPRQHNPQLTDAEGKAAFRAWTSATTASTCRSSASRRSTCGSTSVTTSRARSTRRSCSCRARRSAAS